MDRTTFLWLCLFVAGCMLIWKLYEFAKVTKNLVDNREQHKKENAEFIKTIKNSKKPGRIIFGLSIIVLVFIDYVLNAGFSKGIFNADHSILPHYYLFNDEKLNVTFFISLLIGGYFWHSSVKVKKTVGISDENPEGREIEISSWENALSETSDKIKKNKKSFWGSIAALIALVAFDYLYPDDEIDPKQLMNDIEEVVVTEQKNISSDPNENKSSSASYDYKANKLQRNLLTIHGYWAEYNEECLLPAEDINGDGKKDLRDLDIHNTIIDKNKISGYDSEIPWGCDLSSEINENTNKYKGQGSCWVDDASSNTIIEIELIDKDNLFLIFDNSNRFSYKRCAYINKVKY